MPSSWPGLSLPSTSLDYLGFQRVDARHKFGHDTAREANPPNPTIPPYVKSIDIHFFRPY